VATRNQIRRQITRVFAESGNLTPRFARGFYLSKNQKNLAGVL
jgi:hypothetical protein